jgi:Fe-S-cluster-containing dehydrogenase component
MTGYQGGSYILEDAMITRRNFIRYVLIGAAGAAVPLTIKGVALPFPESGPLKPNAGPRWVFLVDTYKCVGCGLCVKACKLENEIPYEANVTRTWVERYVVTTDRKVHADSPEGALYGYRNNAVDLGRGEKEIIDPKNIDKAFFVPKLCNQCDNPPCVQVCPVGATYATKDGVVLVDRKWCIGCGYCIMGCPYGVRFFHPVNHTAEKCNFCYHRITKGLKPACEIACPFGARHIGDLNDPKDPVTQIIMAGRVSVLKEDYGTKPQNYYVGLSKEVR